MCNLICEDCRLLISKLENLKMKLGNFEHLKFSSKGIPNTPQHTDSHPCTLLGWSCGLPGWSKLSVKPMPETNHWKQLVSCFAQVLVIFNSFGRVCKYQKAPKYVPDHSGYNHKSVICTSRFSLCLTFVESGIDRLFQRACLSLDSLFLRHQQLLNCVCGFPMLIFGTYTSATAK